MRGLVGVLCLLVSLTLSAQESQKLWPDKSYRGYKKTSITPYIAEGAKTAVIVCPGGSYSWLDYEGEGIEVAKWLQENGISAFVLKYRVQGWWAWFWHSRYIVRGNRYPDMYDDGQRALQWVYAHAGEYGIDTTKIGMMGFSAGGHMVLMQGCFKGEKNPAFIVPVYPVVTMAAPCVHKRSRRGLMGEKQRKDLVLRDSLSMEKQVRDDMPPVFLINCVDDPVVDYHNSILMDSALTAHKVPHKYIQYQTGGHGFGVNPNKGTAESRPWKDECLKWLKENGFINN